MATKSAAGILTSVDSMFTTQAERDNAQRSYVIDLPTAQISDFPNHPYKVRMDEEMERLVESVTERGVIVPALVRPTPDGGYQMVSGQRRKRASELTLPLRRDVAGQDSMEAPFNSPKSVCPPRSEKQRLLNAGWLPVWP